MNIFNKKQNIDSNEDSIATGVAKEFLKEQRRSRRWGIFFKLLFLE